MISLGWEKSTAAFLELNKKVTYPIKVVYNHLLIIYILLIHVYKLNVWLPFPYPLSTTVSFTNKQTRNSILGLENNNIPKKYYRDLSNFILYG